MKNETERKGKLNGVVTPIGTPLTDDERVDEGGMRKLVNHLLENGVHGLAVNTTMGGFALISESEQLKAVEIVIDEVRGRVPILAGASDTGTRRTIEKAKLIASLGPDYLIILPPYYFVMDVNPIERFYREITEAVTMPIFLYNNPYTTKYKMPLETIFKLGELPNVVGIKESDQDCERWQELIFHFKGDSGVTVIVGTEALVKVAVVMGADAVMGGLHNIAPGIAVQLYEAVKSGRLDEADRLQLRLNNLFNLFKQEDLWGGFEAALQFLGICKKATASPYSSLPEAGRKRVEDILRSYL
jgi:dihydrodipicolinate synthase/N-acetylneuraminate lyase